MHQGNHTQLDRFWSEMRCRGVVLLASRISVPSPATPCTLFTPNGAPRGLISRICFLPFAGANAGVCFRMVMPSYLSTRHLVSHTDALYTKSPLGRLHRLVAHIERMRLFSVQYAPPTHGQPQCGRGTDCHAHWLAPIKSCRRRSLQLVQLLWRRPPASMIKSTRSSLQGALSTGLPRSIDHTRSCTGMVQEVVNMIVNMGLRIKAQAPAAQRMTRMSFVLPPSCCRGWAGPSRGPWSVKGHASRTLPAHTASVGKRQASVDA